jgi:DNA polymerase I
VVWQDEDIEETAIECEKECTSRDFDVIQLEESKTTSLTKKRAYKRQRSPQSKEQNISSLKIVPHSESKAPILGSSQGDDELSRTQQKTATTTRTTSLSTVISPLHCNYEKSVTLPGGCVNAVSSIAQFTEFKSLVLSGTSKMVCWSVVWRDDSTNFRPSTSSRSPLGSRVKGFAFLPTNAPKAFFLPLVGDDEKEISATRTPSSAAFKPQSPSEEESIHDDGAIPLQERWTFVVDFIERSELTPFKVCFDAKQSLKPLLSHKPTLHPRNVVDPQIAAWIYSPESASFEWSHVCAEYLNEKPSQTNFFEKAVTHLGRDMILCLRLMARLETLLQQNALMEPFLEQEMEIVPILAKMELIGIGFDNEALLAVETALHKKMIEIQQAAEEACGFFVQLGSAKQVATALFDKLKLKPETKREHKGKTGQQSTSEPILKSMQHQHKLPGLVLQYRHIQKTLSNWVEALDKKQINGRIHTTFVQTGTATGRLSSRDPNLQNLPRAPQTFPPVPGSEESREITVNIRDAFVATKGYLLLAADYSQIEMRLLAHIAKDKILTNFFASGKDIHSQVASHWKKKPLESVTPQEREQAKRLVYGITYGMGPNSLSEILDVTKKEAKQFIDSFLESYPEINSFIQTIRAEAHKNKAVRTLMNRRRLIPNIDSPDREEVSKAERQAVNAVIQGTAADVVKRAMIKVDDAIRNTTTRLLLQIHDELIYEVEAKDLENVAKVIKLLMENVIQLSVPLPVHLKYGERWGSMTPLHFSQTASNTNSSGNGQSSLSPSLSKVPEVIVADENVTPSLYHSPHTDNDAANSRRERPQ